jgi:hypothetical protein
MTKQVYFAERDGKIKIGIAQNATDRISALRNGSAEPLNLIAAVPGNHSLERALHKKLRQHRINGEWFKDCRDVRAAIQNSINNFGEADHMPRKTQRANSKFGAVAKVIWPHKTAAHVAAIARTNERTAARWLSGEFPPPYSVIEATMHEIFSDG